MTRKLVFALPLAFLLSTPGSSSSLAAPVSGRPDLAVEYDQVRRIALRDPKVQKAFEKANRQLEEKIVELDPALVDYRPFRREASMPGETRVAARSGSEMSRHVPSRIDLPKPVAKPTPRAASASAILQKKHKIQSGETLGSVASQYHVSVKDLRSANQIHDDRKLAVGQVLIIPATKSGL